MTVVDLSAVGKAIDIPITEAGSIVLAILLPGYRLFKCYVWPKDCEAPVVMLLFDLLRGAAFFPFVLLIIGAIFHSVLLKLVDSNRTTLFLAGVIGASAVFRADHLLMEYLKRAASGPPSG